MAGEEELLQQLMAVTGLEDPGAARYYLEMAHQDCNAAALLFFEQQGDFGQEGPSASSAGSNSSSSSSVTQEKKRRSREQTKRSNGGAEAAAGDDPRGGSSRSSSSNSSSSSRSSSNSARRSGAGKHAHQSSSSHRKGAAASSATDGGLRRSSASDPEEPELRTPDPSYSLRLLSSGPYSNFSASFPGRAGDFALADDASATSLPSSLTAAANAGGSAVFAGLYQPPQEIVCRLPFAKAKELCTRTQRWLLVNLQKGDEFESHKLNRDIWRSEIVQDLIKEFFVFWQRPESDQEGKVFCDLYKVISFPHIAVIDPQTGRSLKQWSSRRFLDPVGAQSELFEFIESEQQKQQAKAAAAAAAAGSRRSSAACSGAASGQPPKAALSESAAAASDSAAAARDAVIEDGRSAAANVDFTEEGASHRGARFEVSSSSSTTAVFSGGPPDSQVSASSSSSRGKSDRSSSSSSSSAGSENSACRGLPDLQLLREKRLRALEKSASHQQTGQQQ